MKKALIVVGIIIAAILLVAVILPDQARVERSIDINAPVELIFDQVNDLEKNWNWSPWYEYDPEMKVTYGEKTKGMGASYSWSGNKDVGSGTLTIEHSTDNEIIKNHVDFGDMGTGTGIWNFEPNSEGGSVKVTWTMISNLGWPVGRYFGLFMDGMVGADFEKGLGKLKDVVEALPIPSAIDVMEEEVVEITFLSVKDSVSISELGTSFESMLGEILDVLNDNDMEMRSYPIAVYHVWNTDEGYTIMEAGIPVVAGSNIKLSGRVAENSIPAGRVVKVVHSGPYDNLNEAHFAIDQFISNNERIVRGSPWEVYIADPMSQPDSTKWITEIYYPIQ